MKKRIKQFIIIVTLLNIVINAFTQETDTVKINITNTIYDTVQVYNNVYKYDTIYVAPFIEKYELSPSYTKHWLSWKTFSNNIGKLKSQHNYTFGFECSAIKNNLSLSTGFFFTKTLNNFEFKDNYSVVDSSINYKINTNSYYEIDTTGTDFYITEDTVIIDSTFILVNDTTFIYLIDSTEIITSDTSFYTVFDTTQIDTSIIKTGKIQYFEIPFIFRFRIYKRAKFELLTGAGIIIGILQYSEFYYRPQQENNIILISEEIKRKIIPSIWLSAKLSLFLFKNIGFFIEPHYNFGIKSLFTSESQLTVIPNRLGIRFGINYRF
ncbi:MAG: hypothetical protein PHW82_01470 [Bacteroidales bacterium]|nr:hypothetical protein [Bacteroidales bacterium]